MATLVPPLPSNHSPSAEAGAGRVKREIKDEEEDEELEKKKRQKPVVKKEEKEVLEIDSDSASSAEIALARLSVNTPDKKDLTKKARSKTSSKQGNTAPMPASPEMTTAKKRTTKGTPKDAPSSASPKAKTAKPRAKAKKTGDASTMPDYASWDREDLRLATASYGYKASSSKTVLVEQMERIWRAIHPEAATATSNADGTASAKSPGKARKPLVLAAAAAAESSGSRPASPKGPPKRRAASGKAGVTAGRTKKAVTSPLSRRSRSRSPVASASAAAIRKRRKSVAEIADAEVDTDSEVQELKTAGETLREAILADEAFYLRLLRYEVGPFTA